MKERYRWILIFIVWWTCCPPLSAQIEINRHCASQEYDSGFSRSQYLQNLKKIQKYLQNQPVVPRKSGSIPLVFHFVLPVGSDSIPMSRVMQQIEVVNECFNRQNHDLSRLDPIFRSAVGYTGPRFCLGQRMENGLARPGIEIRFTEIPQIGDALNTEGKNLLKYETLGGLDAWDPDQYLNIWIGELAFAQGKATFPEMGPKMERGVVIDPDFFGVDPEQFPFHLGKTLVHELGHYFNLKHPWGDEESCDDDDGISDTPVQEFIYTGCPGGRLYSCGSADMFKNFMNFTDDDCLIHFTNGQMEHMLAAIPLFYPDLSSTDRCYRFPDDGDPLGSLSVQYMPANRRLLIELPGPTELTLDVLIFQADGKKVLSERIFHEAREEISLNQLPPGIYILFLRTENNFRTQKLVVY
jgi:hypothetical protein